MSKTYFTISEQKQKVISFIKKHKNILCLDDGKNILCLDDGKNILCYGTKEITADYLSKLEKASNKEFFRLAADVRLKFGRNCYIFMDNCDEKHHMIRIWLPVDLRKAASDKAIKEFCGNKSFEDVIEKGYCYWYNMTPKRWETFEAVFDFYDKPKTPAKKTAKTVFTISEQKQKVINFIKKHKDILDVSESGMYITANYLDELKNASNTEFFRLASKVRLKFGCSFYIFTDHCNEKHRMLKIWLPDVFSKFASDKAIKEFCSINSFTDVIGNYSSWYNMTPKRWETFEAVFDFYDKQESSAKKTAKKAKKIVKLKEVKLSDSAILKDDIVFIDFEADEFDHLMNQGGSNIAVYIDNKSECNTKNQIDHLINAFKLAKKEADTFIELLENAKKQGAKHVVDSSYTTVTAFDFTK